MSIIRESSNVLDCHFTTQYVITSAILLPASWPNVVTDHRPRDQIPFYYTKCHHVLITSEINTHKNPFYYTKMTKIAPFRPTSWPRFPDFSKKAEGRFQNKILEIRGTR